jgi:hypothetical protein
MNVVFSLPFALPGLNARDRTHWAARGRQKKRLAIEVMAAIAPRHRPPNPFQRAHIIVTRLSAGTMDYDNLVACVKPLLDVLCVHSKTHPCGLGIIQDDGPDCITIDVRQGRAPKLGGETIVIIAPL